MSDAEFGKQNKFQNRMSVASFQNSDPMKMEYSSSCELKKPTQTPTLKVWYIYLCLAILYGKCRQISYVTCIDPMLSIVTQALRLETPNRFTCHDGTDDDGNQCQKHQDRQSSLRKAPKKTI